MKFFLCATKLPRGGAFRVFKRPPNELGPNSFNVAAGCPKKENP